MTDSGEHPAAQLALIKEVSGLLSQHGVEHWLLGGWGLDFLLGFVSRQHDDIDFFVWSRDAAIMHEALTGHGYEFVTSPLPEQSAYFQKHGLWIDFTLLDRDAQGRRFTPGPFHDWPWPEEAFGNTVGHLQDVDCPLLGASGQLHIKAGFRHHSAGGPPRKKDVADIILLERIISEAS